MGFSVCSVFNPRCVPQRTVGSGLVVLGTWSPLATIGASKVAPAGMTSVDWQIVFLVGARLGASPTIKHKKHFTYLVIFEFKQLGDSYRGITLFVIVVDGIRGPSTGTGWPYSTPEIQS